MISRTLMVIMLITTCLKTFAQHIGENFDDLSKHGVSIEQLDNKYKDAINVEAFKAVFQSDKEQEALIDAYYKLLEDFGNFLIKNHFVWEKQTRCFNRIYFNRNGTIDYFLYNFTTHNTKPEDVLPIAKQIEFKRLLNLFIQHYKIAITAKTNFAQCSPVTYSPD